MQLKSVLPVIASSLFAYWASAGVSAAEDVYFGTLHSHTSYSDGTGTPDQAYKHAKEVAGLDFIAITEHNHDKADGRGDLNDDLLIATDNGLYNGSQSSSLISAAKKWTKNGEFVALYGQEFSVISNGNHVNVFDVSEVITAPNGDFKALLQWLNDNLDSSRSPALMQFNHPALEDDKKKEYGRDDFSDQATWIGRMDKQVELIEVLNGPATKSGTGLRSSAVQQADYQFYLDLGFHVGPSAGQDNHRANWGDSTDARVAVVAKSLTKQEILDGLKARHTYATEDKNLKIILKINDHLAGDIITSPMPGDVDLKAEISISDGDEPNASYRIDVYSDVPGGAIESEPIEAFEVEGDSGGFVTLDGLRAKERGQYFYVVVTQTDDHDERDRAWTAPVWFEPDGAQPAAAKGLRMTKMLPDPQGNDTENESINLKNESDTVISVMGWSFRDLAGRTWSLDSVGSVAAGKEISVRRNGQPMSMNNGGDTIELIDENDRTVQVFTYGEVAQGEQVVVGD